MITRSETIGKLALALSKAQSQMGHAPKGKDNPFFKSRYADFTAIVDTAKPHLSANELSIAQLTDVDDKGETFLVTLLMHSSGEFMQSRIKLSLGKNDQATGSSMSYMKRYCYAAIIGMATEDEDDDGEAQRKDEEEKRKQAQMNRAPVGPRQPGPVAPKVSTPAATVQQAAPAQPGPFINDERRKAMFALMTEKGLKQEELKAFIKESFKLDSSKDLNQVQFNAIMSWMKAKPVKASQPSQKPAQIKLDKEEPSFSDFDAYHNDPRMVK